MDEAIVGASKGDKVETDLPIPANYSEGDVAGKTAHVKVKVKAVKELTIPEIDDEFAKDIECEGLDDLKGRIKRDLSRVREENERERLKNLALANLIDTHEIEVPESLEKKYLSMIVSRALDNMRAGKPAPGDANLSIDQLREKYRPIAVRSVKEDVILDSIAQAEGIEVTTEELTEAVRHLADARQVSFDELMKRIEREGALEVIRDGIKHEKVFDIIFEHSTGAKNWVRKTGEKAEPEKKAAGKTGAKAKPKAKPKAKAAEKGPGDKKKGGDE
jgi:trigger factor